MRYADRFLALLLFLIAPAAAHAQAVVGHRVTTSGQESVLVLERADGSATRLTLRNEALTLNGTPMGPAAHPDFLRGWSQLLREAWRLETSELLGRLTSLPGIEAGLRDRLRSLPAADPRFPAGAMSELPAVPEVPPVPDVPAVPAVPAAPLPPAVPALGAGGVRTGDLTIRRGQRIDGDLRVLDGDVSVYGRLDGNLSVVNGDVILHDNGVIEGDVTLRDGTVIDRGGRIRGRVRTERADGPASPGVAQRFAAPDGRGAVSFSTLLALFVALAGMGFGFTFYLPKQLDVLTETVGQSFGKSFLAGLFAQPLLPPALAVGALALAITVVGILLIPVAVPLVLLAVLAVAMAGYLAVARAIGDHYVNRRLARGVPMRATPYRSMLYGLAALLGVWLPAAVLGGIPVVGPMVTVAAFLFTWTMATAGLGAAILSQAGLRATFRKPGAPYLTDEHFWLPPASDRP